MARSSALEKRLESANETKKRTIANLKAKLTSSQPLIVGSTIGGGFLVGILEKNNPLKQFTWAKEFEPSLVLGTLGVVYGLVTRRKGQAEKVITAASTGMLTVYAYKQSLAMGE